MHVPKPWSCHEEHWKVGDTQTGRGRAHVLAVLAALATVLALQAALPGHDAPRQATMSGHMGNLGADYETQQAGAQRLGQALERGEAVVVLGSSELTSADLRFIPYKFLSDELAMPVLAYGHAYFQSLGMYFLLASLEEKLSPQSRLVIMVSPGWFDSRGLNREAFKEHVLPLLPRLLGHDEARHALLQWWNRRGNAEVARAALAELGFKLRGQAEQTLRLWRQPAMAGAEQAAPIPWRRPTADWTRLRTEAAAQETAFMASNPYGVRQDYLNKYLGNLTPDRLLAFSDNFEPATELADLERLMALLARHQAKVLFVLQPFNPLVYRDLDRFEATRLRISVLCKQYALACMDMYGVQPYALGTLRDSQHLGELGWLDVSRKIVEVVGE
ncbi:DltD [Bordetella hinzii]|nr:DltD [Bordetella hinzii]